MVWAKAGPFASLGTADRRAFALAHCKQYISERLYCQYKRSRRPLRRFAVCKRKTRPSARCLRAHPRRDAQRDRRTRSPTGREARDANTTRSAPRCPAWPLGSTRTSTTRPPDAVPCRANRALHGSHGGIVHHFKWRVWRLRPAESSRNRTHFSAYNPRFLTQIASIALP